MDLIRENIYNLTSLWSLAGKADGRFFNDEDYAISTIADSAWPNKLWFHRPPSQKLLKEIFNKWDSDDINIPIWQKDIPEQLFESLGFTLKNELTGMSINLNLVKDQPYKLFVQKVNNSKSAALWSSIFFKAFGYWINPRTVELTINQVDYLIGNHGPKSIGTAILYRDDPNIAGFHSIGVVPEHRQNGYASDLLNQVLSLAKKQGAKYATLQASSMGKGLYLKTGFQEDYQLKNFVKR
ncbi:GNAT family N-acetyltransferase [Arenibacter sp. BSSL-BM3]|uniref:GNAT family N-acetyltransferase n=1 Tax=Arenibacter arenosicollis TaxID=2762274 RepID=A0ABR7QT94_9FLAO|nr:GNAT family N-acetyltransferase [Arenibacter arenosicollis]MBC8770409.1 GNAT family N-acetyltransferase [Arenibacter arenosicollis]